MVLLLLPTPVRGLIDPKITAAQAYTDKGLRLMTGEEVRPMSSSVALRSTPTEQEMQEAIDTRLAWQERVLPVAWFNRTSLVRKREGSPPVRARARKFRR